MRKSFISIATDKEATNKNVCFWCCFTSWSESREMLQILLSLISNQSAIMVPLTVNVHNTDRCNGFRSCSPHLCPIFNSSLFLSPLLLCRSSSLMFWNLSMCLLLSLRAHFCSPLLLYLTFLFHLFFASLFSLSIGGMAVSAQVCVQGQFDRTLIIMIVQLISDVSTCWLFTKQISILIKIKSLLAAHQKAWSSENTASNVTSRYLR